MSDNPQSTGRNGAGQKALVRFIGSFIAALGLTWLLREPTFNDDQAYVLFLLFFAIGLWVTEAIPAFAVGLFIIAYLVFALGNPHFNAEPEAIDQYVITFAGPITWLLLGGFFLAAAMTKTQLDRRLLLGTLRVSGSNPRNLLIALMAVTMVASMLLSNTATTAMVVAALAPLLAQMGRTGVSKALLLGVSIAATTGGMGTLIGSTPNVIAVGGLARANITVGFLEWIYYGLPMALGLTALAGVVLVYMFMRNAPAIPVDLIAGEQEQGGKEIILHRRIVLAVLAVTIGLWLTGSWHGITVAAVCAVPLVIFTLTGIITAQDVRAMPWDTLLLVAGALSLGLALQTTGLLDHYAGMLRGLSVSPFVMILGIAYATMVLSNIVSSNASTTVFVPLGMALLPDHQLQVAMAVGLSASMALLLPVSTPPNAIVLNTGYIEQKDFRIGGLLIGLVGPILAVLWIMLIAP
jgi:sodium-dependent dicarboxylate transporter 2/3/5